MPIYLGLWGYDATGNIKYTLNHTDGLIETNGTHTCEYNDKGLLDGKPTLELPNVFYVMQYSDINTMVRIFATDKRAAKICFAAYDEQRSYIENIANWLIYTLGYYPPKYSKQDTTKQDKARRDWQDMVDFGYYHMTHINPYTKTL